MPHPWFVSVWVLTFLPWVPRTPVLRVGLGVNYSLATVSFTNKNIPANPANNTAVSYPTEA
jgi:hypothetical protein